MKVNLKVVSTQPSVFLFVNYSLMVHSGTLWWYDDGGVSLRQRRKTLFITAAHHCGWKGTSLFRYFPIMPQWACQWMQQIKLLHNGELCVVLLRLLMRLKAPPLSYSNETKVNQTEPAEPSTPGALLPPAVWKQQHRRTDRQLISWTNRIYKTEPC